MEQLSSALNASLERMVENSISKPLQFSEDPLDTRSHPLQSNESDRKGNLLGPLFLRTLSYNCESSEKVLEIIPLTSAHIFRKYYDGKTNETIINGVAYIPKLADQKKYLSVYIQNKSMPNIIIVHASVISVAEYNRLYLT